MLGGAIATLRGLKSGLGHMTGGKGPEIRLFCFVLFVLAGRVCHVSIRLPHGMPWAPPSAKGAVKVTFSPRIAAGKCPELQNLGARATDGGNKDGSDHD